jgi:hypothetical protein
MGIKIDVRKLHTTEMGQKRIKHNLELNNMEPVTWCKRVILRSKSVLKRGKNYYVEYGNYIIVINATSHTIITAHKIK